jgi:hypothetical protein
VRKFLLIILSAVSLFSGCYGDEAFERPEVVNITPEQNSTTVESDALVVVRFSKPMDTVKTNNEFSLSSDSGVIDGNYSWDSHGKILTFTPGTGFSKAKKFTIRITENAEDIDGNDLKDNYVSSFHTGGDTGRPVVISYTPAANSVGNGENSTVTVNFSEPVDMNSIYGGITISPSVQGYFSANADTTVITFTPLYGFTYGVTYTVNITNGVMDSAGNRLLTPAVFNFTVGDDFTKPSLAAYQNLAVPLYFDEAIHVSGAEKNGTLTLDFSEEVLTDNLQSAVSISPSVPFFISSSVIISGGSTFTRGIIHFTEDLSGNQAYVLKISSTVTDMQGNALDHSYRFVFVTDGAGSMQPYVTGIGDITGGVLNSWQMNKVQPLNLDTGSGFYENIGIDFSAEVNPTSLTLYAETAAGEGGSVTVVNLDWPVAGGMQFRRLKFGLYGLVSGNTYKITIKGGKNGLKDAKNNFMKEDFVQMIRF